MESRALESKALQLSLLHFLQLMYNLTLSGGAEFFSAQVVKPNISMSVCSTAPLFPHSCSSLSRGCHLGWIIHKSGAGGTTFPVVRRMFLVKIHGGGQHEFRWPKWSICSRKTCAIIESPSLLSIFLLNLARQRGSLWFQVWRHAHPSWKAPFWISFSFRPDPVLQD